MTYTVKTEMFHRKETVLQCEFLADLKCVHIEVAICFPCVFIRSSISSSSTEFHYLQSFENFAIANTIVNTINSLKQ